MYRGLLGASKGPKGCIPWEFQDNRTKFYYGASDSAPVSQDLVWKKTIDSENQFQRLYLHRPKTSESEMASRDKDIFIACSDDDLPVASIVHSLLRQMGYITYSKIGATLSKIDGNGRDKEVRPLHVKLSQRQIDTVDPMTITSEAIKSCTAVMVLCTSSMSAHCPDIVAAMAQAQETNRPLLIAALSQDALDHFPTEKTLTTRARAAIVDLSVLSRQMTDATRESCYRRLSAALEDQLKLVPGGLYKAALAGFGQGGPRLRNALPPSRAPPPPRAATPALPRGGAAVHAIRKEPSAKQMLYYFECMEPAERDAFLGGLQRLIGGWPGPAGDGGVGGGSGCADGVAGAVVGDFGGGGGSDVGGGRLDAYAEYWRTGGDGAVNQAAGSPGSAYGASRPDTPAGPASVAALSRTPQPAWELAWRSPAGPSRTPDGGGAAAAAVPASWAASPSGIGLPVRLADGGRALTYGSIVGLPPARSPGPSR